MGMILLERSSAEKVVTTWPNLEARWPDQKTYLSDDTGKSDLIGEDNKAGELLDQIAIALTTMHQDQSFPPKNGLALSAERWKIAWTLAGKSHNLRPTTSTRRLVNRIFGTEPSETHSTAQVAIARLVGVNHTDRAYAAVLEISEQYCSPKDPLCEKCPMNVFCAFYEKANLGRRHID